MDPLDQYSLEELEAMLGQAPAATSPPQEGSFGRTFTGGLVNIGSGLTLGGFPKLVAGASAGIDSLFGGADFGQAYDDKLALTRQLESEYKAVAPSVLGIPITEVGSSMLMPIGAVTGAVGKVGSKLAAPLVNAAGAANQAIRAVPYLGRPTAAVASMGARAGTTLAKGAAVGAPLAAARELMVSDKAPEQRVDDALESAKGGALLGAAIPAVGGVVAKTGEAVNRIGQKLGLGLGRTSLGITAGDYNKLAKNNVIEPIPGKYETQTKQAADKLLKSGELGLSRDPVSMFSKLQDKRNAIESKIQAEIRKYEGNVQPVKPIIGAVEPGKSAFMRSEKGFLQSTLDDTGNPVILNIDVSPQFQNQGVASTLIKKFINQAKKEGFSQVTVQATPGSATTNQAGVNRLFEKFGFQKITGEPAVTQFGRSVRPQSGGQSYVLNIEPTTKIQKLGVPEFKSALQYIKKGGVAADQADKYRNAIKDFQQALKTEGRGSLAYLNTQKKILGEQWKSSEQSDPKFWRLMFADMNKQIEKAVPSIKALNREKQPYVILDPIFRRNLAKSEAGVNILKPLSALNTTGGAGIAGANILGSLMGSPKAAVATAVGLRIAGMPSVSAPIAAGLLKAGGAGEALARAFGSRSRQAIVQATGNALDQGREFTPAFNELFGSSPGATQDAVDPLDQYSLEELEAMLGGQQQAQTPSDIEALVAAQDPLTRAIIKQESGGRADAVSPKGALGLMQLMPGTAKDLGVDPLDPVQNIQGGSRYISQMKKKFGSDELAFAAYNWGPGNLQEAIAKLKKRGIEPTWTNILRYASVPEETVDYVQKVSKNYREFARG